MHHTTTILTNTVYRQNNPAGHSFLTIHLYTYVSLYLYVHRKSSSGRNGCAECVARLYEGVVGSLDAFHHSLVRGRPDYVSHLSLLSDISLVIYSCVNCKNTYNLQHLDKYRYIHMIQLPS